MTNITNELLLSLQCPITRRRLVPTKPELVEQANGMTCRNQLTNRLGEMVDTVLDEGLNDESGEWLYAVRDGIVCLLADEAIPLDQIDIKRDEVNR